MLQLAIECSGIHGSIAAGEADDSVVTIQLPTNKSSVQSLAQSVKTLLGSQRPAFISVTNGPGSFTGLRVGLTTAKMLSLAWNLPIVAVDTLQVIAHQIASGCVVNRQAQRGWFIVMPVINAFRGQVFTSAWLAEPTGTIFPLTSSCVVGASSWIENPFSELRLPQTLANLPRYFFGKNQASFQPSFTASEFCSESLIIGGPGLDSYQPTCSRCPVPKLPDSSVAIQILPDIAPDAKWVAQVGWQRFQACQKESAASLTANYVRASAAEEKLSK